MSETLGERIRRLRQTKGYTLEVLAARAGVTNVSIHHWEAGSRSPLADKLQAMARALGVSVDYLLTGRETPHTAALHRAIRSGATQQQLLAMIGAGA